MTYRWRDRSLQACTKGHLVRRRHNTVLVMRRGAQKCSAPVGPSCFLSSAAETPRRPSAPPSHKLAGCLAGPGSCAPARVPVAAFRKIHLGVKWVKSTHDHQTAGPISPPLALAALAPLRAYPTLTLQPTARMARFSTPFVFSFVFSPNRRPSSSSLDEKRHLHRQPQTYPTNLPCSSYPIAATLYSV